MSNDTTWTARDGQITWKTRSDPTAVPRIGYELRALMGTLITQTSQYLSATWTTRDNTVTWQTSEKQGGN